uniref:tRNA (uracil(54)-C(5))-methyltransferase n=1 Tax=Latimeria chalumnae TaxID=7897 RepID=H3B9R3_LATCH
RLCDVVTPLWRLTYEEQLQVKYEEQKRVLQNLTARLLELQRSTSHHSWMQEGLCCPLRPTLPSPITSGYRNKSTFSVNTGPDGNPKTVGYYIGTGKGQNVIYCCTQKKKKKNLPPTHHSEVSVTQCYEDFIQQSPLDPCILFHKGGHWREITVRTNCAGDTMAIVYFHPQQLMQEEICCQKESMVEFFTRGPGVECALNSLYFQESTMTCCTHEQSPYQLLHGEPYIYEEVLGLKFRISPDAFFQVNTAGAEILYQTIGEMCEVDKDTTLLDVCCGTGAIGLSLSQQVSRVFGIEVVEEAVKDARWNATLNDKGISNCDYWSGKAEIVLPQLLSSWEGSVPLSAVVNPSRSGLHYRVIRAIRNCSDIRTLVYVSCKPDGEAMRNFLELCCPPDKNKKLLGDPFVPSLAVPVDLFPHTSHCELVVMFQR